MSTEATNVSSVSKKRPRDNQEEGTSVATSKDAPAKKSKPTRPEKCKVCNVKVSYIRPHFRNLRDWMNDPDNVYIGRSGVVFIDGKRFPQGSSLWANPFKIGRDGNRKAVLDKYRVYINDRLESEPGLKQELKKLEGKTLGCWCVENENDPEVVCHGQILAELLQ